MPSYFIPNLALPMGDPAGIGIEVCLKALAAPSVTQGCTVTLVGSRKLIESQYQHLRSISDAPLADPAGLSISDIDLPTATEAAITWGQGDATSGAASFAALEAAIAQTLSGHYHGIVTAPIAKSAWQRAGFHYPGQTEVLAARANCDRVGMMFVARSPYTGWTLRALLATTHIPLRQVPDALTPDLLSQKLDLLLDCLQQDFDLNTPSIAIAGLNPHSGEQGQLGREELEWMVPWLQQMRDRYPHATLEGPVPPDTLWVKPGIAWFGRPPLEFSAPATHPPVHPSTHPPISAADAYLALYHDQGLIPVKLMAFDCAVNTSIGLPFVRTSPDHGTAFDIAGQGQADATSMQAAILLAKELCHIRYRHQDCPTAVKPA
jgi:4-hydroxythreonine-4-phosphate dehydrogenase